jgi:tetratricopeptide (TPR) repeat protein
VPWETFHGREYSWGWALVRFFRQHGKGGGWGALLEHLRTIGPGAVTDSEERRFLEALGFRDSAAFDAAWHAHLKATRTAERQYAGTSPEALAKIAAIAKPSPAMARDFARIGVSLARVQEAEPAVVYLRAAMRGGVEDAEVPYQLARAIALLADAPEDGKWPEEAGAALTEAVRLAPLVSTYRLALGRQLLAWGDIAAEAELGLSLVLLGPSDDEVATALCCLRAATRFDPERPVDAIAQSLAESVPPAAPALRRAVVYYLQETEQWDRLAELIEQRGKDATAEERAMLAGLYGLTDRDDEALAVWRELVGKEPRYWPDLVECLLRAGRRTDAKAALAEAFAAVDKGPPELNWVRRRLERLRVE